MSAPPKLPPHPAVRAQRRTLAILTACAGVAGLALVAADYPWVGGMGVLAAGWFGWTITALPRRARAVQLHNMALERVLEGRHAEAKELLGWLTPKDRSKGTIARGAYVLEATIALNEGHAEEAAKLASSAVQMPYPRYRVRYLVEETHRAKAVALRALAQASAGHEDEALRDATLAEGAVGATPDVLARANLARSVVLARKNDRHALAAHLAQTTGAMLVWLTPRERSLVRALRRMARAPAKSVYRESAKPQEEAEQARLATWIGKIAPGAEAFAHDGGAAADTGRPAASLDLPAIPLGGGEPRRRALPKAKAPRPRYARTIALWIVFMSLAFVVYELAGVATGRGPGTPLQAAGLAVDWPLVTGTLFGTLFGALVVWQVWRSRREMRALGDARLDVARGELARATKTYERLIRPSAVTVVAATAHLGLAQLAFREARWNVMLEQSEAGLARFAKRDTQRALQADLLYPELLATRALALAAMDRQGEADVEGYLLAKEFPTYVLAGKTRFSLLLVAAVRRWARAPSDAAALEAAAAVALARTPDLALPIQIDMLADVVIAAARPIAAEERERIEGELHDDDALRAWVDAVGPGLRDHRRARVAHESRVAEEAEPVFAVQDVAADAPKERRGAI